MNAGIKAVTLSWPVAKYVITPIRIRATPNASVNRAIGSLLHSGLITTEILTLVIHEWRKRSDLSAVVTLRRSGPFFRRRHDSAEERREPADPLADSLTAYLRRDSAGSRRRQCGDSILPGLAPPIQGKDQRRV